MMSSVRPLFALFLASCAASGVAQPADTIVEIEKVPAASSAPAATPGGTGFVTIACNPTCDEVVVGDRSLGPSPIVRAAVDAGTHTVTLKRKDAPDSQITVVVNEGMTAVRQFQFPPPAAPSAAPSSTGRNAVSSATPPAVDEGWLTVVCDPSCEEMIIDGKRKLGRGPYTDVALAPGAHEITLKHTGNPDKVIKVAVLSGRTMAINVMMVGGANVPSSAADEATARKVLEPKVWAGKASLEEMRMLKGICVHMGDRTCRDRVDAMIKAQKAP
jgi:hypothetical protein